MSFLVNLESRKYSLIFRDFCYEHLSYTFLQHKYNKHEHRIIHNTSKPFFSRNKTSHSSHNRNTTILQCIDQFLICFLISSINFWSLQTSHLHVHLSTRYPPTRLPSYFEHEHGVRLVGSTKSQLPAQSWECCEFCPGPPREHSCHTRSGIAVAAVGERCIDPWCPTDTVSGPDCCGTRLLIVTGDGGGEFGSTGDTRMQRQWLDSVISD